ncbi:hypothetical protein DFH06DRAFT_1484029 [Mycena polygramma]|nr:hypothetical protein DFH06DRAFT_1484029 [Mycena polygramma]
MNSRESGRIPVLEYLSLLLSGLPPSNALAHKLAVKNPVAAFHWRTHDIFLKRRPRICVCSVTDALDTTCRLFGDGCTAHASTCCCSAIPRRGSARGGRRVTGAVCPVPKPLMIIADILRPTRPSLIPYSFFHATIASALHPPHSVAGYATLTVAPRSHAHSAMVLRTCMCKRAHLVITTCATFSASVRRDRRARWQRLQRRARSSARQRKRRRGHIECMLHTERVRLRGRGMGARHKTARLPLVQPSSYSRMLLLPVFLADRRAPWTSHRIE